MEEDLAWNILWFLSNHTIQMIVVAAQSHQLTSLRGVLEDRESLHSEAIDSFHHLKLQSEGN